MPRRRSGYRCPSSTTATLPKWRRSRRSDHSPSLNLQGPGWPYPAIRMRGSQSPCPKRQRVGLGCVLRANRQHQNDEKHCGDERESVVQRKLRRRSRIAGTELRARSTPSARSRAVSIFAKRMPPSPRWRSHNTIAVVAPATAQGPGHGSDGIRAMSWNRAPARGIDPAETPRSNAQSGRTPSAAINAAAASFPSTSPGGVPHGEDGERGNHRSARREKDEAEERGHGDSGILAYLECIERIRGRIVFERQIAFQIG